MMAHELLPGTDPEIGDKLACDAIELMVVPRARDIGWFDIVPGDERIHSTAGGLTRLSG